jgi:hypothetical protein
MKGGLTCHCVSRLQDRHRGRVVCTVVAARILFPAVGLAMVAGAFWPYAGKPYEPIWVGVAVGAVLVIWALRPKLTLFEDAVYIRDRILSRLIPN